MANSTTVSVIFDAQMKLNNVQNGVKQIESWFKQLDQIKLGSGLSNNITQGMSKVNRDLQNSSKIIDQISSGDLSKINFTNLDKGLASSLSDLRSLQRILSGIDPNKIKEAFKGDPQALAQFKTQLSSLEQQLQQATAGSDTVKQLEEGIKAIGTAADSLHLKDSFKEQLNGIKEGFASGDIEKAVQNFTQFELSLKKSSNTYAAFIKRAREAKDGEMVAGFGSKKYTKEEANQIADGYQATIEAREKFLNELSQAIKDNGIEGILAKIEELKKAYAEIFTTGQNEAVGFAKNTPIAPMISDVEAARQAVRGMGQDFNSTANQVNQLINRFAYFTTLSGTFNIISRTIRSAFNSVKELDSAMNSIAVVTEMTTKDLWNQIGAYQQMASSTGSTIKGVYEVAQLYYQQGLSTNDVMTATNETLKLARISGLDYADATDYMTAAIKGFGLEYQDISHVTDVYSNLAAHTAASTEEIAIAMSKVASIASSTGMGLETTSSFLTQIIATTREAPETAGTALKTVIARFAEVKKLFDEGQLEGEDEEGEAIAINKIDTALRTAGLSLTKFVKGEQGLDEIFIQLAERWDTLSTTQQRYIATQAAGSRQQSRFLALMEDYAGLQETIGYAQNSENASDTQFAKTMESLETKLNNLSNAWITFTQGIANNEAIKDVVDIFTAILTAINKATEGLGSFGTSFSRIALLFTGLRTGGKALNALGGKAIQKLAAASLMGPSQEAVASQMAMRRTAGLARWGNGFGSGLMYPISSLLRSGTGNVLSGVNLEDMSKNWTSPNRLGMFQGVQAYANGKSKAGLWIDALFSRDAIKRTNAGVALGQIGDVATGATGPVTKLGAAMEALPLGWVAAGVAMVAAAGAILYKVYTKDARALKEANEAQKQANDYADEASQKYADTKEKLDSYNESRKEIDSMTKGTQEWRDAVQELNNQVFDLIKEYPSLVDSVKKGNNGIYEITSEGQEKLLKTQEENANNAKRSANVSDLSQVQAEIQNNRTQIQRKNFAAAEDASGLYNYIAERGGSNFISEILQQGEGYDFSKFSEYLSSDEETAKTLFKSIFINGGVELRKAFLNQESLKKAGNLLAEQFVDDTYGYSEKGEDWKTAFASIDYQNRIEEGYKGGFAAHDLVMGAREQAAYDEYARQKGWTAAATKQTGFGFGDFYRFRDENGNIQKVSKVQVQKDYAASQFDATKFNFDKIETGTKEMLEGIDSELQEGILDSLYSAAGGNGFNFGELTYNAIKALPKTMADGMAALSKGYGFADEEAFRAQYAADVAAAKQNTEIGKRFRNTEIVGTLTDWLEGNNISLDQIGEIGGLLTEALAAGGEDGLNQLTDLINAAISSGKLGELLKTLGNWEATDGIDALSSALDGLSIDGDLPGYFAEVATAAYNAASAVAQIGTQLEGLRKIEKLNLGDTLSADDFKSVPQNMRDLFTLGASGNYYFSGKLNGKQYKSGAEAYNDLYDNIIDEAIKAESSNATKKAVLNKYMTEDGGAPVIKEDGKLLSLSERLPYYAGAGLYLDDIQQASGMKWENEAAFRQAYEAYAKREGGQLLSEDEVVLADRYAETLNRVVATEKEYTDGLLDEGEAAKKGAIETRNLEDYAKFIERAQARGLLIEDKDFIDENAYMKAAQSAAELGISMEELTIIKSHLDDSFKNSSELIKWSAALTEARRNMGMEQLAGLSSTIQQLVSDYKNAEDAGNTSNFWSENAKAINEVNEALQNITGIKDLAINDSILKNTQLMQQLSKVTSLTGKEQRKVFAEIKKSLLEQNAAFKDNAKAMEVAKKSIDKFAEYDELTLFSKESAGTPTEIKEAMHEIGKRAAEAYNEAFEQSGGDVNAAQQAAQQAADTAAKEFGGESVTLSYSYELQGGTPGEGLQIKKMPLHIEQPVTGGTESGEGYVEVTEMAGGGDGNGASKGGGGGGGGGKQAKPKQDPWHNYITMMERDEQKLKLLTDEMDLLLDPTDRIKNFQKQQEMLAKSLGDSLAYQTALDNRRDAVLKKIQSKYGKAVKLGKDGALELTKDYFKMSGDSVEALDALIDAYNDILSKQDEQKEKVLELKKELKDLYDSWRDDYVDLVNQLAQNLEDMDQNILDDKQDYYDKLEKLDEDYLESVRRNVEEERRIRDRSNDFEDLQQKQARLAMLQRDTSGMYAAEIASLQDEINDAQQQLADQNIDSMLDAIEQQNEDEAKRHEEIIKAMEEQIESNKENRVYIQHAEETIASGEDAILSVIMLSEDYKNASDAERAKMLEDAKLLTGSSAMYNEAARIYGFGNSSEYINAIMNGKYVTTQAAQKLTIGSLADDQISIRAGKDQTDVNGNPLKDALLNYNANNYSKKDWEDIQAKLKKYNDAAKVNPGSDTTIDAMNELIKSLVNNRLKAYKEGGMVDFTGPAWVDGTKAHPEAFLNPRQTELIAALAQSLSLNGATAQSATNISQDCNININIGSITSDYNLDSAIQQIKNEITNLGQYRNVNILNRRR